MMELNLKSVDRFFDEDEETRPSIKKQNNQRRATTGTRSNRSIWWDHYTVDELDSTIAYYCRHIPVVNTIQVRNQIVEMRRPSSEKIYIGDVTGDSLSPKLLKMLF
ncbi:unnamed protein product [Amaranthus hypochondriacus]